jgi:hypothetical protein
LNYRDSTRNNTSGETQWQISTERSAGVDTFILVKGAGIDLVRDFKAGGDRIGFRGNVSNIHFVAGQGSTVVK